MNTLGISIKQLRKSKNMTLKKLAEKTGLSISFLSQLERGKSSATLESLKKISLVFNVNPGYFFEEVEQGKQRLNRGGGLEAQQLEDHGISYRSLSKALDSPIFSPMLVVLKPAQNRGNLFQHAGQEFLYVLEGVLTVQIADDIHTLHPSESLMFDSANKHYWYNYTEESVKFICVAYDEPK